MSQIKSITAEDVVVAAKFISDYWIELVTIEEFLKDLDVSPIDYHILKWTSNLGIQNNTDVNTLFSVLGQDGVYEKQVSFFRKQLNEIEKPLFNVTRRLHEITS